MVAFGEIIAASFEWTTTVLFRPFKPKKWFILAFIALLAGEMGGFSSGSSSQAKKEAKAQVVSQAPVDKSLVSSQPDQFFKLKEVFNKTKASFPIKSRTLLVSIIIFFTFFFFIMMWLSCRFDFIFLEAVTKNSASIKKPFKENKVLGNSLFLFYIVFTFIAGVLFCLIGLPCVFTLVKAGAFIKGSTLGFWKIFFICLPYACLAITLFIAQLMIFFVIKDFVLVVMFKEKIRFIPAWGKTLKVIYPDISSFALYFLIKIGLGVCALIAQGILRLIAIIALLIPGFIVGMVLSFLYHLFPVSLRFLFILVSFLVFSGPALFLIYCVICLNLPFAVFFRALSVKFFARISPEYDLFLLVDRA